MLPIQCRQINYSGNVFHVKLDLSLFPTTSFIQVSRWICIMQWPMGLTADILNNILRDKVEETNVLVAEWKTVLITPT